MTPNLQRQFDKEAEKMKHEEKEVKSPNPFAHFTGVLGPNQISPRHIPHSDARYRDLADVLNHKGFTGWYDQTYMPVPDYFTDNNLDTVFSPPPMDSHCYGIMTIADMIHMTNLGMSFRLEHDSDMDLVVMIAQKYLEQITAHMDATDRYRKNYAMQVEQFLKEARKVQLRMHKRTGKVKDGSVNIADLLAKLIG